MPRGFGKARLELTVKEDLRERLAAKTGTDPNIEVTKTASNILETIAEDGSYWSAEDKRDLNILNRHLVQIGAGVNNWAESSSNWLIVYEKQITQVLGNCYKLLHESEKGFTIFENVISRLYDVIDRYVAVIDRYVAVIDIYESSCKEYKDTIDYLKDELVKAKIENIRLKAIQAEHCIGCPAPYLQ